MLVIVEFLTVFLVVFARVGQAQNEEPIYADIGITETASKESYNEFRQVFNKHNHLDRADASTETQAHQGSLAPPPKPREIRDWPKNDLKLGQVTAIAIHPDGNPVLFHRHDRIWKEL